jgi:hypothetical protein
VIIFVATEIFHAEDSRRRPLSHSGLMEIVDGLFGLANAEIAELALVRAGQVARKRLQMDRPATSAMVVSIGGRDVLSSGYRGSREAARTLSFKCLGWATDSVEQPPPACSLKRLIATCSALLHIGAASGDYSLCADASAALMLRALSSSGAPTKISAAMARELRMGVASILAACQDFADSGERSASAAAGGGGSAALAMSGGGDRDEERPPLERAEAKALTEGGASLAAAASLILEALSESATKIVATRTSNGDASSNPAPELGATPSDAFLGAAVAFAPDGTAESSLATSRAINAGMALLKRCADGLSSDTAGLGATLGHCATSLAALSSCASLAMQAAAAVARSDSVPIVRSASGRRAATAEAAERKIAEGRDAAHSSVLVLVEQLKLLRTGISSVQSSLGGSPSSSFADLTDQGVAEARVVVDTAAFAISRVSFEALPFANAVRIGSESARSAAAASSTSGGAGYLQVIGTILGAVKPGKPVSKAIVALVQSLPDYLSSLPGDKMHAGMQLTTVMMALAGFRGLMGDTAERSLPKLPVAPADQVTELLSLSRQGLGVDDNDMDVGDAPNASQVPSVEFREQVIKVWSSILTRDDVIGRCASSTADFSVSQLLYCARSTIDRVEEMTGMGHSVPPAIRMGIANLASEVMIALRNVLNSSPSSVARDAISNSSQLEYTIFRCLTFSGAPLLNVAGLLVLHDVVFQSFKEWTVNAQVPLVRRGTILRSARVLMRVASLREMPAVLSHSKMLEERYGTAIPPQETQAVLHQRMGVVDVLLRAAFGDFGPALDEMVIGAQRGALAAFDATFGVALPKPGEPLGSGGVPTGVDASLRPLLSLPRIGQFLSLGYCRGVVEGVIYSGGVVHFAIRPDPSTALVARDAIVETVSRASTERARRKEYRDLLKRSHSGTATTPPPFARFNPTFGAMRGASMDDPGFTSFAPLGAVILPADEALMRGLSEGWRPAVERMCTAGMAEKVPGAIPAARILSQFPPGALGEDVAAPGFLAVRSRVFGSAAECGGRPQPLSALAPAASFEPLGCIRNSFPRLVVWRPVPHPGYVALGVTVTAGGMLPRPESCWCVHSSLAVKDSPKAVMNLPHVQLESVPAGLIDASLVRLAGLPPAVVTAISSGSSIPVPHHLTPAAPGVPPTLGCLSCASCAAVVSTSDSLHRLRTEAPPGLPPPAPGDVIPIRGVVMNCLAIALHGAIHAHIELPAALRHSALDAAAAALHTAAPDPTYPGLARVFGPTAFSIAADSRATSLIGCAFRPRTVPHGLHDPRTLQVLSDAPYDTTLHRYLAAEIGSVYWTARHPLPTGEALEELARVFIRLAQRHSAGDDRTFVSAALMLGLLTRDCVSLPPPFRAAIKPILVRLAVLQEHYASVMVVAPDPLCKSILDLANKLKASSLSYMPAAVGGCCDVM